MSTALLLLALQASALPPVSDVLDCAREADLTLVAVHRAGGFGPGIPENSLAGIRAAGAMGAAFAEVDLRETADGEIVLMHDTTLDRTTTGSGALGERTLAELQTLHLVDAHGDITGERIPTISEAFDMAAESGVYLELDLKGLAPERVSEWVASRGLAAQSMIIVYEIDAAGSIQAIVPETGISLPLTERDDVLNSELDFSTLVSWVGHGVPNARTEALLTGQGIETAMHDFPGERDGTIDYAFIDAMHVELLASDNPQAAVAVLGDWRPVCGR